MEHPATAERIAFQEYFLAAYGPRPPGDEGKEQEEFIWLIRRNIAAEAWTARGTWEETFK